MLLRASLLALGAFALVACAEPVSPPSAPPNVPKQAAPAVVDNSTVPVQFTLSAALCGLPTDVTGTGVFHAVTRVSQSNTGEWKVVLNLSAHGTASGTDGSTYVFDYAGTQDLGRPRRARPLPRPWSTSSITSTSSDRGKRRM